MEFLNSASNLLLVLAGFTFIIFIHELGHFVAAKWAGIRVLAFAIGFGPAVASYRKGMGFRRGSSEVEYLKLKERDDAAALAVSPTEYRWNWLPFGGYVKMLGQEDVNPNAISAEPDSYQMCVPWKRMVVISAGVIFNVILAVLLFMLVFTIGIQSPPAKAGPVSKTSPSATTMASNASELGIKTPGIKSGDLLLSINGREMSSFADVLPEVALSNKDEMLDIRVRRQGIAEPLRFNIKPMPSEFNGVLDIGIAPPISRTIYTSKYAKEVAQVNTRLAAAGLSDVRPGMDLISAGGKPVTNADDLIAAVDASAGNPIALTFKDAQGEVSKSITPRVSLERSLVQVAGAEDVILIGHLLGLVPVMKVGSTDVRGQEQGLRDGDVFVRVGDAEYPSLLDGIREIRAHKGKTIDLVVNRREGDSWNAIPLKAKVDETGRIGFGPSDTREDSNIAALSLKSVKLHLKDKDWITPPAGSLITSPGTRILKVNGKPVNTFRDIRATLLTLVPDTTGSATLSLTLMPPSTAAGQSAHEVEATCQVPRADLEALRESASGWESPLDLDMFKIEEALMKADGPAAAISKGVSETRRWMLSVYVTFVRLYQGSVPVNQLHGPVGIASVGTSIADRGVMYLLLFMAMISVNLAVVNFLPLPIVDGGQFLFLVWEQIRGKPASLQFQNAATLAGLVLIGAMFLFVTFNDITALFHR